MHYYTRAAYYKFETHSLHKHNVRYRKRVSKNLKTLVDADDDNDSYEAVARKHC